MATLLCSRNDSVLRRWNEALKNDYRTFEATTLDHAYKILAKSKVEVILLHRSMANGEQLQKFISDTRDYKIFTLSDKPNNREGIYYLRKGCVGYSNTYIAAPRLNLAVQTVLSGMVWTGTALMQHLIDKAVSEQSEENSASDGVYNISSLLSKREYQVATLVAEGLNNREIADRLYITERTVKAHLSSIYSKTETGNRVGLVKVFSSH